MIYFDPQKPNKYASLKKLLVPYRFSGLSKQKYGAGDGGYVLAKELLNGDGVVLSYGIGSDPEGVSFEEEMMGRGWVVHMYDGGIKDYPKSIRGAGTFFPENLTPDNFAKHIDRIPDTRGLKSVLKMDIEGCEYKWLTEENLILIEQTFDQIAFEVHGLISEIPDNWIIPPEALLAKNNLYAKERFFRLLNSNFSLFHIHGNNHSPRYVDFPDSLELTYINKNTRIPSDAERGSYPIAGLDEPNLEGREDYVLNWWV